MEEGIKKTALSIGSGITVTPFGLCNVPATF